MRAIRPHFIFAGLVSFFINILYLASPLYMLQVYDRALGSGSVGTLVLLSLALVLAIGALATLDTVRSRIFGLIGETLDDALAGRIVGRLIQTTDGVCVRGAVLRELDAFRSFFSGQGIQAAFDIPWTPVFIIVSAILHPWLGILALAGSVAMLLAAYMNEQRMREAMAGAHESATRAYVNVEHALAAADQIKALGMREGVIGKWLDDRSDYAWSTAEAGRRAAGYAGLAKFLRLVLQSAALGLGAYLAIDRQITPGAMIAGSILVGRALSPLDQVFGAWRSAGLAREAYRRIRDVLDGADARDDCGVRLWAPRGVLRAEAVVVAAPESGAAILRGVSLAVEPGEMLGVIGPCGAGKSTLARALAGARAISGGSVRLDGAEIAHLDDRELGRQIGYLPQEVALFPGTIGDNISRFGRFAPDADVAQIERDVEEAARAIGVHELIRAIPGGYDAEVGPGGIALSGGQRQLIGLARAFYGNPPLVILDEPYAHLDSASERALLEAMSAYKRGGRSLVVVTHRASVLAHADSLLLLRDGVVADTGRRDDVVRRLQPAAQPGVLSIGTAA